MSNTYVNSYKTAAGVAAGTYSLGFTPTVGNTLIAWAYCTTIGATITSATMGGSNNLTVHDSVVDNTYNEQTYCFSRVVTVGDAASLTFATSSGTAFFYILEVSGVLTPAASGYEGTTYVRPAPTGSTGAYTYTAPFSTTNNDDFVMVSTRSGSNIGAVSNLTAGYTLLPNGRYASEIFYSNDVGGAGSKSFAVTIANGGFDPRIHIYRFITAVPDPTVTTITSSSAAEGSAVTHTVTLSGPTGRTTSYAAALTDVTAAGGVDFTSDLASATYNPNTVTFSAGNLSVPTGVTSFTVTVATIQDTLSEANETYTLTIGGTSGTGTIIDNDPVPSISASNATESFNALSFDVTLSDPSGQVVAVNYATANGSKTAGVDYQATTGAIGFNPGDSLTKKVTVFTAALPPQVLRFASPLNYITEANSVAANTTYLSVRARIPLLIGSGDLSQIVLAFGAWNLYAGSINFLGNAYTVVSCAIEKDDGTYAAVNFIGSRSKVIADGTAESLSDPVYPSAFGLGAFTRGDKYWIRVEYSVASTGLKLPQGKLSTTQWGTGAASAVLTSGAVASAVDATGTMTFTSGNAVFNNPYSPIVLGKFVTGDPPTIIGIGDSIMSGYTDTSTGYGQLGGFSFGLTNSDHVGNPYAGANFGYTGSSANLWASTNSSILVNYLKYAKYAMDEYETNRVNTDGALAVAQSEIQALWAQCATAGIKRILRWKLLPRSSGTDGTVAYSTSWSAGGDAVAFNNWLNTPNLGVASGVTISPIMIQSLRASTNPTSDNYLRWAGATSGVLGPNTSDGTHPNAAGYTRMANDLRGVFGVLK